MNKLGKVKIAIFGATLALMSGCVQFESNYDIPSKVVDLSYSNVYLVKAGGGTGSGFWYNPTTMMTACHVVSTADGTEILAISWDNEITVQMKVVSCDKEQDIALLKPIDGKPNFGVKPIWISPYVAKQGKAVWGPGYPMGDRMFIGSGHFQINSKHDESRYMVSIPTMKGDSGSPVFAIIAGKVYVVGIRQAVAIYRTFRSFQLINHIAVVSTGEALLDHIRQHNVVE